MITSQNWGGPMPIYAGVLGGQAALASGSQVSVSVNLQRNFPRNPGTNIANTLATATIIHVAETNVLYVAEVDLANSGQNFLRVNVRQVGSAASANTWSVQACIIALEDLVSG